MVEAGSREAVTQPLALHKGTTPLGKEAEKGKKGKKERMRDGGPERIRERKQHSCSSRLFYSVKRHFLIKAILALYLEHRKAEAKLFFPHYCVSCNCMPDVLLNNKSKKQMFPQLNYGVGQLF